MSIIRIGHGTGLSNITSPNHNYQSMIIMFSIIMMDTNAFNKGLKNKLIKQYFNKTKYFRLRRYDEV